VLVRIVLVLLLALNFGATAAAADKDASTVLVAWSKLPEAQRNRVLDASLAPEVKAALLEVLARGVSPCECFTRRIRWAWALPGPRDPAHPALIVSFSDPPRDQTHVAYYARFAHLRFVDGRYAVSSSFMLKRPALTERKASLSVHMKPRRDLDRDGQIDVALSFSERWPGELFCGAASFASSGEQLSLEEGACESGATTEPLD
jgi:hypothetical protein